MIRHYLAKLGHVLVDWFDDELTDVTDLDKLLANERAKGRREAVDEMTAILKRPRVGDPIACKRPADDVPPSSTLPSASREWRDTIATVVRGGPEAETIMSAWLRPDADDD